MCIICKHFLKTILIFHNYNVQMPLRQEKMRRQAPPLGIFLLFAERHAVGTLIHGGVCFVGAHGDPIQGAVVGIVAMISTLLHGAFDTLVGMTAHSKSLLFI